MKMLGRGFTCIFLLYLWFNFSPALEDHHTYIIHIDHSYRPSTLSSHEWHISILVALPPSMYKSLLYSYNHVMHGFSATLTKSQVSELEKHPAHRATYREVYGKFFTTYTPSFLGLNHKTGLWPAASYGEDVIIGIIDTGIWPESKSFHDRGMPPIPDRWKGLCEDGTDFNASNCNLKIIGARSFNKGIQAEGSNLFNDYNSTRDAKGHGTHTASTAAGNYVVGAGQFGYAMGTARGVAPLAHLAIYKVGWRTDEYHTGDIAASDVLAGMDQAIEDGVDIMSLSFGLGIAPYFDDAIAIASFAAIQKGITIVCAAGNSGNSYSVANGAPWIITVGASTTDRSLGGTFTLANGLEIQGNSGYPQSIYLSNTSLFYGNKNKSKAQCDSAALDTNEVRGMVVFCDYKDVDIFSQMQEVERAGALVGIFMNGTLDVPVFSMASLVLNDRDAKLVRSYAKNTNAATVKEMKFVTTRMGLKPAPQVTSFSSRGPNPVNPGILKPDIVAPGEDVLGAAIPNKPIAETERYALASDYALDSGTSMATPHVAGLAALLKAVYPKWSPAAIRSAILTTAFVVDNTNSTIRDQSTGMSATPLDFGAGHINPNKAMDPGLVYDIAVEDYINFLCAMNYTSQQIQIITRRSNYPCDKASIDLNYPSFTVVLNGTNTTKNKFKRLVTNVHDSQSVYRAAIWTPPGMKVTVEPMTLTFGSKYSTAEFTVEVEISVGGYRKEGDYIANYGYLSWNEITGNHVVRSPIVAAFAPRK